MMDDRGMRLIESLLKVGLMHLGGLAMGRMHLCRVEQSLRSSFALRLVTHFFPDTKLTWTKKKQIGYFSAVYKGTWRKHTVTIKVPPPRLPANYLHAKSRSGRVSPM
jgi:hypothetical protein